MRSSGRRSLCHLTRIRRAVPNYCVLSKPRASLFLQGRYMGFMRQLKPRLKAQVRKVKEAKGVRAAIVKAKGLAQN